MLQVQNAGNKLGRRCDMCSNYERQLQGIQIQEADTRDQVSLFWSARLPMSSFSPGCRNNGFFPPVCLAKYTHGQPEISWSVQRWLRSVVDTPSS